MHVFNHPHVAVQRAKEERYNERVQAFMEECDALEAQKRYRLLYQGDGERSMSSLRPEVTNQDASRTVGTAKSEISGPEPRRQHRYPGIGPVKKPCSRHGQNPVNNRPASSSCPYAQPTLQKPHIPVDHAAQRNRIHWFAEQRQRSAKELLANQHRATIEQHRSKTRPVHPQREVNGVIRREIERVRAAKGLKPASNLRGS